MRGQNLWCDVEPILDQELGRLPDKYRAAIVLCDLEGKTREHAARQLGVPEGTVSGWLTRGRAILANRLVRRGLAVSVGSLATALAQPAAAAHAPVPLVSSTIKAVTLFAAGQAAAGAIPAKVAALAEGVLKAMLLTKLKIAAVSLSLALAVALAGTWLSYRPLAAGEPVPTTGLRGDNERQAGDHNPQEAVYELQVEVLQAGPNPNARTAAVAKDLASKADKSDQERRLRFALVMGETAKAQLGRVATVGAVKRDPLGLFIRVRIHEEKANKVILELALEDVGLVEGKADIKRLVEFKKPVPLGERQEHPREPSAGASKTSGFALKFIVTRIELPPANASSKKGAKAEGDRAKLQGIWTGYVAELAGKPMPDNLKDQARVQILLKGGELTLRGPSLGTGAVGFGFPVDTRFTMQLNEDKEPNSIDLMIPKTSDDVHALAVLGLYALDGDNLKLCINVPNKKRPPGLRTQEQTSQMLFVLKRDPQANWEPLPKVVELQPQP
jgi:uncharacterized protein (TIGR03067 family)